MALWPRYADLMTIISFIFYAPWWQVLGVYKSWLATLALILIYFLLFLAMDGYAPLSIISFYYA